MKKWISVALATFCTVSFAETITLEEYNELISEAKNQTKKQLLACEREANYMYKDAQQCIKGADMLLEMSKKATKSSLLRCELLGFYGELCKSIPTVYQKTDKEFFNENAADSYYNAGVIFDKNMLYEKSVAMYKKAIEYNPKSEQANLMLGIKYFLGEGIAMNKNKAYEHWRIAAKQGHQQAQKNLDLLCSESPWACK